MKDLALHILDIIENSTNAGASKVMIAIVQDKRKDVIRFSIQDNGSGMDAEILQQLRNPFYTTRITRKVGLGIPLLIQNSEQTGGNVKIESQPGKGTTIVATFISGHIDCPPIGDIADVLINLIISFPEVLFEFILEMENNNFAINSEMIKEVFGKNIAMQPEVIQQLKFFIRSNIHEVLK